MWRKGILQHSFLKKVFIPEHHYSHLNISYTTEEVTRVIHKFFFLYQTCTRQYQVKNYQTCIGIDIPREKNDRQKCLMEKLKHSSIKFNLTKDMNIVCPK